MSKTHVEHSDALQLGDQELSSKIENCKISQLKGPPFGASYRHSCQCWERKPIINRNEIINTIAAPG